MQRVLDEFVVQFALTGDPTCQSVVVDSERFETVVPDGVVRTRQRPTKVVMVQVQMPKCDECFSKVRRERPSEFIVGKVKVPHAP